METKLPFDWFSKSEPEKLLWYASEHKEEYALSHEPDSYFLSPGAEMSCLVAPLEEYDFAYFFLMKRTFYELLCNCTYNDAELLTKITASALLKNQPDLLDYHWVKGETASIENKKPHDEISNIGDENIKPQELSDFHYPM